MGFSHSTYLAYGVRIEDTPSWVMEEKKLNEHPPAEGEREMSNDRVGFLHAGDYDEDMTFLVTYCESVNLGSYYRVPDPLDDAAKRALWDENIAWAVKHNGFLPAGEPVWFVVPDCS